MSSARLWVIGWVQCVFWGVLYYAFPVLFVPVANDLATSPASIAAAFSLALLVRALLAPRLGRAFDGDALVPLLRSGMVAVPLLLVALACVPSAAWLVPAWLLLGVGAGLVLYESSFALVIRSLPQAAQRLRALALVTVAGGLASTVFVPLAGAGVAWLGWRSTLLLLALCWLVAAWVMERAVLRGCRLPRAATAARPAPAARAALWRAGAPFVASGFATSVLLSLLVPALLASGHPIVQAALVLGGFGVMQLPGRVWMLRTHAHGRPAMLLVWPLLLQLCGLTLVGLHAGLPMAAAGVALCGLGAGLYTIARPWALAELFGSAQAGAVNGRIARVEGFGRALGPVAGLAVFEVVGAATAFAALAACLGLVLPLAIATARRLAAPPPGVAAVRQC